MRKVIVLAEHVLFTLNVLLIFFLVFETRLVIPPWLQVVGRMHPLILHFPIVIILLGIIGYFFVPRKQKDTHDLLGVLLIAGALAASVAAIMGMFLAKEEGYGGPTLQWHKWGGVIVSLLAAAFYMVSKSSPTVLSKLFGGIIILFIVITGHLGAELSHGENFLLAPVQPVKVARLVSLEEAIVYDDIIAPILEEKCITCHNPSKSKGELVMSTKEGLLKGGKTGSLLTAGKPEESLLIKRLHLPEDDKKHMPPKNKPQLTEAEISLLHWWIRSGAELEKKVIALPEADTFRLLSQQTLLPPEEKEVFDFAAADSKTVDELNTAYRTVYPLAENSPALAVNIYNAATYTIKLLEDLKVVKHQIVSLDLNKMPVKDEDLKIIGNFTNLRKLNLNFTKISGRQLQDLKSLQHLKTLSLSGTTVALDELRSLSSLKKLEHLYLWSTALQADELKQLRSLLPGVLIETGFKPDPDEVLTLTPPRIKSEKSIFTADIPIEITHPIPGTTIRYTLDGTEPDSIHSEIYTKPFQTKSSLVTIKCKAFKTGWNSSNASSAAFYKTKHKPDTLILLTVPHEKYQPQSPLVLIDRESGDLHYGSNEGWVGYQRKPFQCITVFGKPTSIQSLILSVRSDVGAHIFPPAKIEIWGGTDQNNMQILRTLQPQQPVANEPNQPLGIACDFDPSTVSCIKVVAYPVDKLPAWHAQRGEPGWLFVDELLFN